jgi:NAD(P)H-dependent FMN reductase
MDDRNDYPVRILVFAASLRNVSLNERLASLVQSVAAVNGATVDRAHFESFDSPSYDQDAELAEGFPQGIQEFHRRVLEADALVIVSPEYNASMPGYLKNVIDWASRLRPQPFKGKHALLMSASPSMAGGNRGLWALRIPLEHLGMHCYPDMFSLAQAHQAFDEQGRIADPNLMKWFEGTVECFLKLVEAAKHYPKIKRDWVEFLGERGTDEVTRRVEEA